MIKIKLNRIPPGIPSLNTIIRGGFPSGCVVLLIGDAGAGSTEFAYTSSVMLSLLKNDDARYNKMKGQLESFLAEKESLKLPESICYISFLHSKEDILNELEHSFPPEFAGAFSGNMFFKDFSSTPQTAVNELLKELISVLDFRAPDSLVIIDSLTALIRMCKEWHELISFLKDLQKKSKKWDGLVYLLLGKGVYDRMEEEEVMDIADGVLVFEWVHDGYSRQQAMYIKKFRGLMPRIAKNNIVKFDTLVTNTDGFMVINDRRISGYK